MKLSKPCLVSGCPKLVERGSSYCDEHEPAIPFRSKSYVPLPPDWKKRRRLALRLAHYRCAICGEPADEVDHVIPRAAGGSSRLANLQVLCSIHHSEKSEQDRLDGIERSRRRGR